MNSIDSTCPLNWVWTMHADVYRAATSGEKDSVLGAAPHDYKKALSDLAGIDGKPHSNKPEKAVLALRNWFIETVHLKKAESATVIWYKFTDFAADFYRQRKNEGFTNEDLKMMPIREYIASIRTWIDNNG